MKSGGIFKIFLKSAQTPAPESFISIKFRNFSEKSLFFPKKRKKYFHFSEKHGIMFTFVSITRIWSFVCLEEYMPVKKLICRHALIPLCVTVVLNFLVFYGSRPIAAGWYHWDLSLPLDAHIPLVTQAIYIYILAFLSWAIGACMVGRQDRELCYELLAGENIAKLLCLVIFLALPTSMERPEITGDTLSAHLMRFIYAADQPNNLFPSIHCLENWFLFRASLRCKGVRTWEKVGYLVFALLVFAATVLVKQHVVVDILGGIVVVELGLALSKALKAGRLYQRLNRRFSLD